jgi:cytoskeletal protein RodZ
MAEIGETLREARMRARIDISEVEAATKIRAKYLRAIENEEWDLLPGAVYIKSFLRTYGDYLGVDSRLLIDEFKRRYEQLGEHEVRPAPVSRTRERDRGYGRGRERMRERVASGPLLPPWVIVAAVLVAIVIVLFAVGSLSSPNKPAPTIVSTHHSSSHTHTSKAHSRAKALTPKRTAVTLALVPTGQVYVCVVNGKGKKLIPGLVYATGQSIPTERAAKLLLTLGNNAVQMKVDGKRVTVAASASSIGYSLTPGSVTSLPAAAQPTCA